MAIYIEDPSPERVKCKIVFQGIGETKETTLTEMTSKSNIEISNNLGNVIYKIMLKKCQEIKKEANNIQNITFEIKNVEIDNDIDNKAEICIDL